MPERLATERKNFEKHIEEWRTTHVGQYVLIKGNEVIGFFDSLEKAFDQGSQQYGMSDFFIEQILPADTVNVSFIGQVV